MEFVRGIETEIFWVFLLNIFLNVALTYKIRQTFMLKASDLYLVLLKIWC